MGPRVDGAIGDICKFRCAALEFSSIQGVVSPMGR